MDVNGLSIAIRQHGICACHVILAQKAIWVRCSIERFFGSRTTMPTSRESTPARTDSEEGTLYPYQEIVANEQDRSQLLYVSFSYRLQGVEHC
jgi:hypothetical protein